MAKKPQPPQPEPMLSDTDRRVLLRTLVAAIGHERFLLIMYPTIDPASDQCNHPYLLAGSGSALDACKMLSDGLHTTLMSIHHGTVGTVLHDESPTH